MCCVVLVCVSVNTTSDEWDGKKKGKMEREKKRKEKKKREGKVNK
jgi:hypothetical protein